MVAPGTANKLGIGLYTPAEAARFAKLRTQTLTRWLYGNQSGDPAVRAQLVNEPDARRVVTFWDLIQVVAIRQLRTSPKGRRIALENIRDVVSECESQGLPYPLARRHTLYWYADRLIVKIGDRFFGTTKSVDKHQQYEHRLIEQFLTEVTFGDDQLVETWSPLRHGTNSVSLNASRRFGMPTIEPGGILASALVDAVQQEGSIEDAAEAFEVDRAAVELALKYDDYLASAA